MIMHSNYLLEVDNSSASNGLSDMERKQYLDQIKELVQTVQTLLDANIALGNKQKELQAEADRKIAGLQDQVDKLTGELQARRRKMHGKNNEKQTGDKDGNEFAFFVPKDEGVEQRACTFVDESKYDMPSMVPHTSSTSGMLSDLIVNRFQYAITSGREMYRMVNEKMRMSKSTIFNWLRHGAEFLENCQETIKQWLLKPGSTIYCDESWVDTKVTDANGEVHYKKRYMWVIVNLTTKVCYYLYGSRKKEVIKEFLGDFKGTLMTDAYAAYLYFNKLKDCTHVCCWSHVRRLFVSASRDYKDSLAQAFIDLIGILYKVEVENQVLGRTEKEIVKHRGEESLPVLHDLYQQATALLKQFEKNKIKFSAKLQQALIYMTKHWEELMAYTKIGSVLIDNNCCERAVRPFTNLRKNFGGISSEQGARVTATFLTFVETCKLMATAPLDFFRGFFDMIVAGRRDYALMTEALLVKPV